MALLPLLIACEGGMKQPTAPVPPPLPADADFEKMGTPKPGEWLYRFPEEHQSFEDYRQSARNIKSDERKVIYLQPLGGALKQWPQVLEKMREYSSIFFNCETKVLEPLPMFEVALDAERKQYDSDIMIRYLVRRAPQDALMYIGITDSDLFAPGLNFVFGSGSLVNRCGVYSLVRLVDKDAPLFLRRSIGLMTHEAGHLLSITHCVRYKCLMNGSNSLAESDAQPIFLCPEDLRKVQYATGFDTIPRYEKILAFLKSNSMTSEAAWLEKHLSHLR